MQSIPSIPLIVSWLLVAGLSALSILLGRQRARLEAGLREARAAALSLGQARTELEASRAAESALSAKFEATEREDRRKADLLDNLERENEWLREELERRPKVLRRTYKILTLGISGTGKTALTLKWANPLTDLGALAGTKIDRYERTVSRVTSDDVATEHVFEIGDWGGEYIVDAHNELVAGDVHGLLLVVDLAGNDAGAVDAARVEQQLREFQPEVLKFFFGPRTVASCKAVVLFINKSDLLSGTPAEVEREARRLYHRLIEDLGKYEKQLDIRVLVGSASYGHATHHLFSHFVERVLPRSAYDAQLLKRMKSEPSSGDG